MKHPGNETDDGLVFGRVALLLIDQKVSKRRDRIRLSSRRISDRDSEVRRDVSRTRGRSSSHRLDACLDPASVMILDIRVRKFVVNRVNQLDVTDGAGSLLHQGGYTLIALAAETHEPFDRSSFAGLFFPIGAGF